MAGAVKSGLGAATKIVVLLLVVAAVIVGVTTYRNKQDKATPVSHDGVYFNTRANPVTRIIVNGRAITYAQYACTKWTTLSVGVIDHGGHHVAWKLDVAAHSGASVQLGRTIVLNDGGDRQVFQQSSDRAVTKAERQYVVQRPSMLSRGCPSPSVQ